MTEFESAITVIWCGVTYWLGGQELPWFKRGFKWIRRFVMPLGLCFSLITFGGILPRTAILACSLFSATAHPGYQNKLWKYALTGLLMGLPALLIDVNVLCLLPMAFHTIYGLLSLKMNKFRWSFVGILMGIAIGIAYVSSCPIS